MATGSPGRNVASRMSCSSVPCGVAESGVPAESSAVMPKRASSAATRRASARSGVINAACDSPCRPGSSSASLSAMAMAVASSRSLAASIRATSAKACAMPSGSSALRHPLQRSVLREGAMACDRIFARKERSADGSPSGKISSRVSPKRFRSWNRPNCGWVQCAGSARPPGGSTGSISAQSAASMVRSRPGSTTTPCGSFATAPINAQAAGIEPVEPATITGPAACRLARRWASERSSALRWRTFEERPSSSSRAGQKALAIFRNSVVSCHQSAWSCASSFCTSSQSRSSFSSESMRSARSRASQMASAGLAGATSGESEWMSRTICGRRLRQARTRRASSSSRAVPGSGCARSMITGESMSK